MTDTYTPILTDAQIGAIVCDVYKKTGAAEIGELRLKQDAVALGRAVERAAIAAYQRQHAAESLLLGRILSMWHNTGETGDVDGGWLQDVVIAAGLATQGDEGYVLTPRAMELIGLAAGERS